MGRDDEEQLLVAPRSQIVTLMNMSVSSMTG